MKTRTVFALLMAAALVWMTGCQFFQGRGGLQTGDGWTSRIAGSYKGDIFSGRITKYAGTTTFKIDDKGVLTGTYELDDNGTTVTGTLSDFTDLGGGKLACKWHDKNGTGDFTLTFAEDLSAFDGLWSNEGQDATSAWNGKK